MKNLQSFKSMHHMFKINPFIHMELLFQDITPGSKLNNSYKIGTTNSLFGHHMTKTCTLQA